MKDKTHYYLDWDYSWDDSGKLIRVLSESEDVFSRYQRYDASKNEYYNDKSVMKMLIGELWCHRISEEDAKRVVSYFDDLYKGNDMSKHNIEDIMNNHEDYKEEEDQ